MRADLAVKLIPVGCARGMSLGLKFPMFNVCTAVHAEQGHKAAAEQLLKCGANINATSSRRATALFMSAYYGHVDVTLLLLAWGKTSNHTHGEVSDASAVAAH